jgi:hypothetical protein
VYRRNPTTKPATYLEALRLQGLDYYAQLRSRYLKDAVKETIDSIQPLDKVRRRAKMLLQSVQFLDIDKLIRVSRTREATIVLEETRAPLN